MLQVCIEVSNLENDTSWDIIGIISACSALSCSRFFYKRGHRADSLISALIGYLLGNDVILKGEQS